MHSAGSWSGLVFTPLLVQEEVAALFVADLGAVVRKHSRFLEVPARSPILLRCQVQQQPWRAEGPGRAGAGLQLCQQGEPPSPACNLTY